MTDTGSYTRSESVCVVSLCTHRKMPAPTNRKKGFSTRYEWALASTERLGLSFSSASTHRFPAWNIVLSSRNGPHDEEGVRLRADVKTVTQGSSFIAPFSEVSIKTEYQDQARVHWSVNNRCAKNIWLQVSIATVLPVNSHLSNQYDHWSKLLQPVFKNEWWLKLLVPY